MGVKATCNKSSPTLHQTSNGANSPTQILDRDLKPFNLDDFDFVMNVNVRGTIDLIRQCLPHMAKTKPIGEDGERGIVIMVASSAAFDGQPGQGKTPPPPDLPSAFFRYRNLSLTSIKLHTAPPKAQSPPSPSQ